MKIFCCILLGCLLVNLLITPSVFAESKIIMLSKSGTPEATIRANQPQVHVEQEVQIPTAATDGEKEGWFSKYKWWLLAGLVVVGGAAAAGGGGGGGSSSDTPTPTTGNIQIDW